MMSTATRRRGLGRGGGHSEGPTADHARAYRAGCAPHPPDANSLLPTVVGKRSNYCGSTRQPRPGQLQCRAMKKLRWGVLGVAKIAVDRVVPAMQRGEASLVTAIASRDRAKADAAAAKLGIATAYGSYDALLADADVDAVYIPLPNHLHVPWT